MHPWTWPPHQGIVFEWDSEKAAGNIVKHGVSFENACEAFFDPFIYVHEDEIVDGELRESFIGMSRRWTLFFVVLTIRVGDRFRIISAREATPTERQLYEGQ